MEAVPLKVGFLSPHNPYDRRAFSGTVFHAARALEALPDLSLRILGPHRPPRWTDRFRRPPAVTGIDGMDLSGLDAVLGLVASPLLDQLGARHPELPFLHVTDATPRFLTDVYGWKIPATAQETEQRVVKRAALTVYSSDTMADRAPVDLETPGMALQSLPFGVNLERLPAHCPQKAGFDTLRLLFVGLDWVRKGGDIAIATLDALKAQGQAAHLTVIGRCPDQVQARPDVTYLGYLNKNRSADLQKVIDAYTAAHLLLLPSRADCTPMVVGEALAHGTPVIATDTGGIGSLIGSGTGVLMPQYAPPETWAREIQALVTTPDRYAFTSEAGFDRVRTRLSWATWARGMADLVHDVLATPEVATSADILPLKRSSAA